MKKGRPSKDLAGARFEFFTITNVKESRADGVYWLCKCDCGKEFYAKASDLSQHKYKSCGCYRTQKTELPLYTAAINRLYGRYKTGARLRNYYFDLTLEEFKELILSECYYCGIPPSTLYKEGSKQYNGMIHYNGIDRVDNSKGYTINNVVPCCKTCNVAKATMTHDEFVKWVERVYRHMHA